jgi:ribosomal protein S18 acetylase RimI-like enzyme
MLRVGFGALPLKISARGMVRFIRATSASEKFHKTVDGPHWYLLTLGTSPAQQGKGLGSALIEQGTAKAEAAGLPCYLETATESNVAFYEKRGFEVIGQAPAERFTLYGMVRHP